MENINRKRPYLERACKILGDTQEQAAETGTVGSNGDPIMNAACPLDLIPRLWRKLPVELAYKVLSFLPVDKLVGTLRSVNPRWEKFLQSQAFLHIFGHGSNLFSSYGFVIVGDPKVPRLSAFEHESCQWRQFPKRIPPEVRRAKFKSGSSGGLLLCRRKRGLSYSHSLRKSYSILGVWNPVLQSFKWLPPNPDLNAENCWSPYATQYAVMVDESSRTYKVLLQYKVPFSANQCGFYSVYNSSSRSWTVSKRIPDYGISLGRTAACDRYVFLEGYDARHSHASISEDFVCWYDAHMDTWQRVFLSKILTNFGYTLGSDPGNCKMAHIDGLATLHGRLYMVIYTRTTSKFRGTNEHRFILASLDPMAPSYDQFDDATAMPAELKLETIFPEDFVIPDVSRHRSFNVYTYTLKGKGYVCFRKSSDGRFLHYDVSSGVWLEGDKFLALGNRNSEQCGTRRFCASRIWLSFKPSLVLP